LDATSAPIATMIDAYDNVANRTSRNKDGTVTTWSYDQAYHLIRQHTSGGYRSDPVRL
jgi:YD repeat-containing protein